MGDQLTTAATATELYGTDAGFREFIAWWVNDRRCPFPLADYLRELGLEKQADVAFWATNQPDKKRFWQPHKLEGVFPGLSPNSNWYWCVFSYNRIGKCTFANEIFGSGNDPATTETPEPQLLWLLDNYTLTEEDRAGTNVD